MKEVKYGRDDLAAKWDIFSYGINRTGGNVQVGELLRRLKFDTKTINDAKMIYKFIELNDEELSLYGTRKLINAVECYDLAYSIINARMKIIHYVTNDYEHMLLNEMILKNLDNIENNNDCLFLKDLKIKGNDLIEIGYKPGKDLGHTLNTLLNMVFENPNFNNTEKLISLAKSLKSSN